MKLKGPELYSGFSVGIAALIVVTLGGCGLYARLECCSWFSADTSQCSYKADSVQDAVSVHIAALSVDRWDNASSVLQPQFGITPATALALALPRTAITQNAFASVFSGEADIGLPQTTQASSLVQTLSNSLSRNKTANIATGGTAPGSTTTTTTTGANGVSTSQTTTNSVAPGTAPGAILTTPSLPSAAALVAPTGPVQMDPMLTYTAATAIYQEVQMLSDYIQTAALEYNADAYLGRVQISVVPLARNEPYDVYVDLGMFSKCLQKNDIKPVRVVPLLVTDDLESGQATTASEIAQQLALSLGGIVNNVAGQGRLSDLRDRFKAVLGTDFNSLYTISRGADNVIQVRLGASRNPNLTAGYTMLSQTHNVSFVVLVDHDHTPDVCQVQPQVDLTSFTRLRDARTGEELRNDRSKAYAQARTVVDRFTPTYPTNGVAGLPNPFEEPSDKETLGNWIGYVQMGGATNYEKLAGESSDWGLTATENLWTGLATVISMSEYAGTHFNLPMRPTAPVDAVQQTVFLHDNCKDTATATLSGLGSLTPANFKAILYIQHVTDASTTQVVATSITQSAAGGPFTLQFPSLVPLATKGDDFSKQIEKVCPDTPFLPMYRVAKNPTPVATAMPKATATPSQPVKLDAYLTLKPIPDSRWQDKEPSPHCGDDPDRATKCFEFDRIVYDSSALPDTTVALIAGADAIATDASGSGTIRLLIKGGKGLDDVALSLNGGLIASLPVVQQPPPPPPPAPPKIITATFSNGGLILAPLNGSTAGPNAGQIVLDVPLSNLIAGRAVTITATGEKAPAMGSAVGPAKAVAGSSATIVIPVVPLTTNLAQPGGVVLLKSIP